MRRATGKNSKGYFTILIILVLVMHSSCSQTRIDKVEIWNSKVTDSILLLKRNLKINDYVRDTDSIYFYYFNGKKEGNDNISLRINSVNHSIQNIDHSPFHYSPSLISTVAKKDISNKSIIYLTIYNYNFNFELTDTASLNSVFLQPIYNINDIEKIEYLSVRLMEINYRQLLDLISDKGR